MNKLISEKYKEWEQECNQRFQQLKQNEEELNRIFIDIYGLQDELTPEVADKDVTVRKADLQREIKALFHMPSAVCLADTLLMLKVLYMPVANGTAANT